MKKCCFIIPYFGNMPNYFSLFLKSCEKNKDYDWLIFSDDTNKYELPSNVKIKLMKFQGLKNLINDKLGMKCTINEVHKLCDFKPAYGLIFEDYLSDYKFWGHCDLDIILGNLNKFITDDMLEKFDKIFCLGHMILYKNNYENNRVFMNSLNGKLLYKEVFTSEKTMIFDETFGGKENIDTIFREYGKKVFSNDLSFNVRIFPGKFVRTRFEYQTYSFVNEKYKKALYIWDNGNIKRYYIENEELICEEYIYIHLQQRIMKFDKRIEKLNKFKIIPNEFLPLEFENINIDNFKKIKKGKLCMHSIKTKIRWKKNGLIKKLKKFSNL